MGVHVHVDVQGLTLEHLKNICLTFIKHEAAMDSFMPNSRRHSEFCRSNRDAILPHAATHGVKHNEIVSCDNLEDLCDIVNPGQARYYKLNLQNLQSSQSGKKKGKQTIEFRQHSCTTNYSKIEAWVRFCARMVKNSTDRPRKLLEHENEFDSLFDTVIQDLKLKAFYKNRRAEISHQLHDDHGTDADPCCDTCGTKGGYCEEIIL